MTTATAADVTVRHLRQLLTDVSNQDLTVRELRTILFHLDDQDQPAGRVLPYVTALDVAP